jgi:hypothetical protein
MESDTMRRKLNTLIGASALALFVPLVDAAILNAQLRPTAEDAELAKLAFGSARGLVVDVTGRPVEGATIEFARLWDVSDGAYFSQHVKSDFAGRFTLDQLRPGWYRIDVQHERHCGIRQMNALILGGDEPAEFTFTLSEGGSLRGRVVTVAEGVERAVAGADVYLWNAAQDEESC